MEIIPLMAQGFWRMLPASAAAEEWGVNIKTVQKYYDHLRRAISRDNERSAREQFGSASADPALFLDMAAGTIAGAYAKPLFCLAQQAGKITLLFSHGVPSAGFARITAQDVLGWVYARDCKAFQELDLDGIHFLSAVEGFAHNAFWIYAKRNLVRYHGGFRKNFHLFVREMEFRFNNSEEDMSLAWLTNTLKVNRKYTDRR